ncbi:putative signal transducing protein [Allohahella marinimesophila]|uniref:Sulfotransferase n=1 Tax=Allohahella marinimesophila TaxID=1054972 RepID=A0ABP7Q448_9GAMM
MKVVYEASNTIEAYLLKSRLEHEEVLAWITGEFLQGGIGELAAHGHVRVMVADDDVDRARVVIKQYEKEVYTHMTPIEFIGIGVTKGGSSWLADMLSAHPQVCLSEPKEIRYFNTLASPGGTDLNPNRQESLNWYHHHFSHCPDGAVRGEYTPLYLADPDAVDNILAYNPRIKILICLRDPLARLVSHYRMNRDYVGIAKRPIEEEIKADGRYLEQGLYGQQIERLYQRCKPEQVLLLFMEDVEADKQGTVARMYDFLGVDPTFVPAAIDEKSNAAKEARFPWVGRFLFLLPRFLVAIRLNWLLVALRKANLHKLVLSLLTKKSSTLELSDAFKVEIRDYYRQDIIKLEGITGRDLSGWYEEVGPGQSTAA